MIFEPVTFGRPFYLKIKNFETKNSNPLEIKIFELKKFSVDLHQVFNFASWPFWFSILIFRQAKRRRLTLDSLNSSNAEIETALKNHKKEEIVLNINTTPTEEENKLITQLKGKFKVIFRSIRVNKGHLRSSWGMLRLKSWFLITQIKSKACQKDTKMPVWKSPFRSDYRQF